VPRSRSAAKILRVLDTHGPMPVSDLPSAHGRPGEARKDVVIKMAREGLIAVYTRGERLWCCLTAAGRDRSV
jgi:hypothetical protein